MKANSRKKIIKAEKEVGRSDPGSLHYFYTFWLPLNYPGIAPCEILHP